MENKKHQPLARFKRETLLPLHLERKEGLVPGWLCLTLDECYDDLASETKSFLHSAELEKYSALHIAKRKASFLLGRYCLKKAAGAFLGSKNYTEMEIRSAILEYPILKYPVRENPDLTLSHSDRICGAIAFQAGHVMGLDIEWINPARKKVFERILTRTEHALCHKMETDDLELFGVHWSFKEALSKAVKCGFTVPFHILELADFREVHHGYYETHFKNFGQFRGYAWVMDAHAVAIVLPKKTRLKLDPSDWTEKND